MLPLLHIINRFSITENKFQQKRCCRCTLLCNLKSNSSNVKDFRHYFCGIRTRAAGLGDYNATDTAIALLRETTEFK